MPSPCERGAVPGIGSGGSSGLARTAGELVWVTSHKGTKAAKGTQRIFVVFASLWLNPLRWVTQLVACEVARASSRRFLALVLGGSGLFLVVEFDCVDGLPFAAPTVPLRAGCAWASRTDGKPPLRCGIGRGGCEPRRDKGYEGGHKGDLCGLRVFVVDPQGYVEQTASAAGTTSGRLPMRR